MIAEFRRVLYGKRSEKPSEDERQLAFEDLETAAAEEAKTLSARWLQRRVRLAPASSAILAALSA